MRPGPNMIAAALGGLLAAASPAFAGDISELNILGFSADTRLFGFEEFGVQDGSGFPYTRRFYIEVDDDRFAPGTPIRIRIDDESATLEEARNQARDAGQAIVADAELAANRGNLAAYNPVTELSADPHRIAVNPRPVLPPVDQPFEVRLEEVPMATPARCEGFEPVFGYRLIRIDTSDGGRTRVFHEDSLIPQSRGCPTGYRLGAVQTVFPDNGAPAFAVLIQVRSFGFEGPNYDWIAVTGRL